MVAAANICRLCRQAGPVMELDLRGSWNGWWLFGKRVRERILLLHACWVNKHRCMPNGEVSFFLVGANVMLSKTYFAGFATTKKESADFAVV